MAMRFRATVTAACACALAALGGSALAGDRDERRGHGGQKACGGWDRGGRGHMDLDVVGTTATGRLICFEDDDPERARDLGTISGLTTDTRLVGIDYRPATGNDGDRGDLYGVGDQGGVYVVDDRNGKATLRSRLNVALAGQSFGVDFNPTVDRLRIVSDAGQNLRVDVDTGATTTDGGLAYPPAAGPATGVAGAAYTNNDADPATGTTLFDIDGLLDQVAVQSPANSGQLAPTGKLGVDAAPMVGSDIYSTVRNGTTVRLRGLAALTVSGRSGLYRIDLLQGRARARGYFPAGIQVSGIAIPLNQG
jgi:hypothetical protein